MTVHSAEFLMHTTPHIPHEEEGRLSVDVAEADNALIITSTIAGARPEDIAVFIDNDILTIRGKRQTDLAISQEDYFYKECYWGAFSRSIVLPIDVKPDEAEATFKNGVLTIRLPKETASRRIPIIVIDEE